MSEPGRLADADTLLKGDRACMKCGYNLRGLDPAGRCPECGLAVAESLRADPFAAEFTTLVEAFMLEALCDVMWWLLAFIPVTILLTTPLLYLARIRTAMFAMRASRLSGFTGIESAGVTLTAGTWIGVGGCLLLGFAAAANPRGVFGDVVLPSHLERVGLAIAALVLVVGCWMRLWAFAAISRRLEIVVCGGVGEPAGPGRDRAADCLLACGPLVAVALVAAGLGAVVQRMSSDFAAVASVTGLAAVLFLFAGWCGMVARVGKLYGLHLNSEDEW